MKTSWVMLLFITHLLSNLNIEVSSLDGGKIVEQANASVNPEDREECENIDILIGSSRYGNTLLTKSPYHPLLGNMLNSIMLANASHLLIGRRNMSTGGASPQDSPIPNNPKSPNTKGLD